MDGSSPHLRQPPSDDLLHVQSQFIAGRRVGLEVPSRLDSEGSDRTTRSPRMSSSPFGKRHGRPRARTCEREISLHMNLYIYLFSLFFAIAF